MEAWIKITEKDVPLDISDHGETGLIAWNHDYHLPPIGRVWNLSMQDDLLSFEYEFAPKHISTYGALIAIRQELIEWSYAVFVRDSRKFLAAISLMRKGNSTVRNSLS